MSDSAFRDVSIEALCARVTSGGTPLRTRRDFYDGGTVDWFKTGELNDWYLDRSAERITTAALDKTSAKLFPANTVLVAMYGDGRTITTLGMLRKPAATNQACAALIADPTKCDPRFLFYALRFRRHRLIGLALGGAQRNLSAKTIKQFMVPAPNLETQGRIAAILSAYDDLIENCQRRIRILEDMARGLYREWFVHFRFPGVDSLPRVDSPLGRIPHGWEVRGLMQIANVIYGFPFRSEAFNAVGRGVPVVRIRNIPSGASETFSDESADVKYVIEDGDVLVGMDGDFHMCIWAAGHAMQNQRVAKFRSAGEIGTSHLFLALEAPIQALNKAIVGTTVAHLGDMHVKRIEIVWPPAPLRVRLNDVLEPMAKEVIALKKKITNLRRTRDLLLPRLLSGQINVAPRDTSDDESAPAPAPSLV